MLKNKTIELFCLSFVTLFVELLVIRWTSADVRAFTVLKGFPLAACFVGMGLGCASGNDRALKWAPLWLLLFATVTKVVGDSPIALTNFPSRIWAQTQFQGLHDPVYLGSVIIVMFEIVLVLAGPFLVSFALGSRLGVLFNSMRPIKAYCINLAGALTGTIIFALCSCLSLSPSLLLAIPAVYILICLFQGTNKHKIVLATIFATTLIVSNCLTVGNGGLPPGTITTWSPYERLDLVPFTTPWAFVAGKQENVSGYGLRVNKIWQQKLVSLGGHAFRFDPLFLRQLPQEASGDEKDMVLTYDLPFLFKRPAGVVLSLGSGLGNDVAAAVANGAEEVDAVEIDPATIEFGKKYNTDRPYQSPKVHIYCDDARHYIQGCSKKYDLIRFAFLDSTTVISQSSTNRLDNFVYTKESVANALGLLKPDGLLFLSFDAQNPWFINRLDWTMTAAAGYEPLSFSYDKDNQGDKNVFFVLGRSVKDGSLKLPAEMPKAIAGPLRIIKHPPEPDRILTDDWPYLYWAPGGLDFGYLAIVFEVLVISLAAGAGKMLFLRSSWSRWQMFFLGAGFLLLELQSISRLSLLYGSTWITSSVVISGVLIMLLAANVIVIKQADVLVRHTYLLYLFLAITIFVSCLLPVTATLQDRHLPISMAYAIVTFLTLLPMFLAGLIFAAAFDREEEPSIALGFNLLGGVIGTLLEYLTSYVGISNILIVAACLYLFSFICATFKLRTKSDA